MSYKKGADVLPAHLLREVQKYVNGTLVYIPKTNTREGWGCLSGSREILSQRNRNIMELFKNGLTIGELASRYYLSEETIKKIIYGKK